LPKNTYVVSFGLKARRSLWMYSEVVSWLVFSAVRSVKGFLLSPKVFSKSVVGMAAVFHTERCSAGAVSAGTPCT
jgi:hypothetical protein